MHNPDNDGPVMGVNRRNRGSMLRSSAAAKRRTLALFETTGNMDDLRGEFHCKPKLVDFAMNRAVVKEKIRPVRRKRSSFQIAPVRQARSINNRRDKLLQMNRDQQLQTGLDTKMHSKARRWSEESKQEEPQDEHCEFLLKVPKDALNPKESLEMLGFEYDAKTDRHRVLLGDKNSDTMRIKSNFVRRATSNASQENMEQEAKFNDETAAAASTTTTAELPTLSPDERTQRLKKLSGFYSTRTLNPPKQTTSDRRELMRRVSAIVSLRQLQKREERVQSSTTPASSPTTQTENDSPMRPRKEPTKRSVPPQTSLERSSRAREAPKGRGLASRLSSRGPRGLERSISATASGRSVSGIGKASDLAAMAAIAQGMSNNNSQDHSPKRFGRRAPTTRSGELTRISSMNDRKLPAAPPLASKSADLRSMAQTLERTPVQRTKSSDGRRKVGRRSSSSEEPTKSNDIGTLKRSRMMRRSSVGVVPSSRHKQSAADGILLSPKGSKGYAEWKIEMMLSA